MPSLHSLASRNTKAFARNIIITMTRRQHLSAIVVLAIVAFFSVSYLFSSGIRDGTSSHSAPAPLVKDSTPAAAFDIGTIDSNILVGGSIAPKLENATAKYVTPRIASPSHKML